jgi:hypothetical protein
LPDTEEIGAVSQLSDKKLEEDKTEIIDSKPVEDGRECDTPAPNGQRTPNAGEQTPTAVSPLPNVLPWTSKVRQCEVEQFIQVVICRI